MLFNVFNDGDSVEPRIDSGAEKIGAEKLVLIPTARNSDGSRKSMLYIPIAGKSVFVGRDATQAQIVINRNVVSKKHAQIISYEHSIMLLDCYSTNGTFVNGEKISKRTVHPGDTIEFGEEKYILSYV
jgi:pSer/pThr/pTyr-binding forkhead associated (FHA) protein